jgi:hypothetical protein
MNIKPCTINKSELIRKKEDSRKEITEERHRQGDRQTDRKI